MNTWKSWMMTLSIFLVFLVPGNVLAQDWEELGSRTVAFNGERARITVSREKEFFNSVRLSVTNSDLSLTKVEIKFGNGTLYSPSGQIRFDPKSLSWTVNLREEGRVIRHVKFWYTSYRRKGTTTFKLQGKRVLPEIVTMKVGTPEGDEWPRWSSPGDAGWSYSKLNEARIYANENLKTAAVMIIYKGKVVHQWGETKKPFKCHSMRKSILSMLYGPHVTAGTIKRYSTLGQLHISERNISDLTEEEKKAKVSGLLKSRSGIYLPANYETTGMAERRPTRGQYPPGTHWYYNNWDFNALCTIFEHQTGRSIFEEFEDRLAKPLGMQDFIREEHTHYSIGEKSIHPAYPFTLSARDLARIGLLMAQDGKWENKQIITKSWVLESTKSYSTTPRGGGYGYMWWVEKDGKMFSYVDLPDGSYAALGSGGHKLVVIPDWDTVIAHRVDTFQEDDVTGGQFGRLLNKIIPARP